jgi:hypothetical protein
VQVIGAISASTELADADRPATRTPGRSLMSDTPRSTLEGLLRLATGIVGRDAPTGGGLPKGDTTLLCGTTRTARALLSMQFLAGVLQSVSPRCS